MSFAHRLYDVAPYPFKMAMAGARGAQLELWRYGRDFEALVDAAKERETWAADRWSVERAEVLGRTLEHAATHVPFYREQWARRRRGGDRSSWTELVNWPVLRKSDLRAAPRSFLADGNAPWRLYPEHTSGSTGTPLSLSMARSGVKAWYALFEQRTRRWHGVRRGEPWAIVGGQLIATAARSRPPFWVWNPVGRQLYLSAFHISPATGAAYAAELARRRPRHLIGYPSALAALAEVLPAGAGRVGLVAVSTNAEPLSEHQRDRIERAFGAPVYDTYGMSEAVVGASECGRRVMHLWPEAGVLEVFDDSSDELGPAGEPGRFVATGLLNPAMPLVRYETGDRGSLDPWTADPCGCGRTLPCVRSIEGRVDDLVLLADGRRVGRLDGIFKADLDLREAQIVQEDLDRFRIVYVRGAGTVDEEQLADLLRQRVGPVEVRVEQVPSIPRAANGKFRAVISHAPSGPSDRR